MMGDERKRATPLQAAKMVLWGFFGVRKRVDHEADSVHLTPVQVIVTGIVAAMILVIGLILLVRFIAH